MATHKYRDLIVWQKSMDLVMLIYKLTLSFPESEKYGLTSQMRRCAISIPSNIAEGSRRDSKKDFRKFILISFGSGAELETQLEISVNLKYISKNETTKCINLLEEIMKMLNKLQTTLKE